MRLTHVMMVGLLTVLPLGISAPASFTQPEAAIAQTAEPAPTQPEAAIPPPEQNEEAYYMVNRYGFRFVVPVGYVPNDVSQPAANPTDPVYELELWTRADFDIRETLPEAPPLIRILIYENPQQLPLENWKGELSADDDRPITVSGQDAIAYSSTGLYESDNVLVSSPDGRYVVRLMGNYMDSESPMRQVFQNLVANWTFDLLPSDQTASGWRINYEPLQTLLNQKDWQAADRETRAILLRLAQLKEQPDDFSYDVDTAIANLPCTDLRTIDTLWSIASDGRFGYSAQLNVWNQISPNGTVARPEIDRFGEAVGWRRTANAADPASEPAFSPWLSNTELTYSDDAPVGHFPWPGVASESINNLLMQSGLGCGSCTIDAMYLSGDRYYDYLPALFTKLDSCLCSDEATE